MEPLDLTKRPPRSPREKLGGLVFLARTIDKMRALLPGGNIGTYKLPGGSTRTLEQVGIDADKLQAVVAHALSEEEVVAWVRAHSDANVYDEVNRAAAARSVRDVAPERLPHFNEMYPHHKAVKSGLIFDIIDDDDAITFGTKRT
jgi:hypothetical protein